MPHQINTDVCYKCGACVSACPVDAIHKIGDIIQIDANECVDCQTCARICPAKAVEGGPDRFLELKSN